MGDTRCVGLLDDGWCWRESRGDLFASRVSSSSKCESDWKRTLERVTHDSEIAGARGGLVRARVLPEPVSKRRLSSLTLSRVRARVSTRDARMYGGPWKGPPLVYLLVSFGIFWSLCSETHSSRLLASKARASERERDKGMSETGASDAGVWSHTHTHTAQVRLFRS